VRKPVLAGIIFIVAFLAILLYSTLSMTRGRMRVEVCMEFNGRTNCGVASAKSRDAAMRTAITNACALISGGVTDSQQCESSKPVSVKWLDGK
jgi:hypothetical protein